MRKEWVIAAIAATLAIAALYTPLAARYRSQMKELPPGIRRRECRLVRIWLMGEPGEMEGWLKKQAAAYEKQAGDVRIYLRRADAGELDGETEPPDGIVFTPGSLWGREEALLPLTGNDAIAPEILRAVKWRGEVRALPLCLAGYAWVEAEAGGPFQAAAGMPLLLAASMAPKTAALGELVEPGEQSRLYEAFCNKQCGQTVLTLNQLKALAKRVESKGEPAYTANVFPLAATDRYWLVGVGKGENRDDALAFGEWLLEAGPQQALEAAGLFSVNPAVDLYGSEDGLWDEQEAAFLKTPVLPNAFALEPGKLEALGHSAFQLGENPAALLEPLR